MNGTRTCARSHPPSQFCRNRGCQQRADSSDLDRQILRTPLCQFQKDVLWIVLASSSNKHNFLSFYALWTIMEVSASLCSFFMYVFRMWHRP